MVKIGFSSRNTSNTGFGSQASAQGDRLVNKNGSYNVNRTGAPFWSRFNHFHDLITMKWWKFFLFVFTFYTTINLIFAGLFLLVGMEELDGDLGLTTIDHFWDAFFFSSQTLTTVGYGRTNPIGLSANLVAAFECLLGLMSFAILTGVLYARFSKPKAKLVCSHNALMAPFNGGTALMMRIANGRSNNIIECEAQLMMSYIDRDTNRREFEQLTLEYKSISALALSWTIVHPITDESPLKGLSHQELHDMDAEFVLMFKAFDEIYAQTVHSRVSYTSQELIWGAKFESMFHRDDDGRGTVLEIDKIGLYREVDLMPKPTAHHG
jgi:inward rectifier potassium channel